MSEGGYRIGPRPLALHAFAAWRAHVLALAAAGGAPGVPGMPDAEIAGVLASPDGRTRLPSAVLKTTGGRWGRFWEGVARYHAHPYRRPAANQPTLWRAGECRLLDFAPGGRGLPIIATPSLVNSSDVLDLLPGRSLMAAFAEAGFRPFLIDWGRPETDAASWSIDRYVAERLAPMADAVEAETGRAPALVGYCMGGLLATALAAARPDRISALALMAMPWNFHAHSRSEARALAGMLGPFQLAAAAASGAVPTDMLQILFFSLDPTLAARKFRNFAAINQASAEAELFVAMEDWVNGGPPLAWPVAEVVLRDWFGRNLTAKGQWRVQGRTVGPDSFSGPTLIAAPTRDRIVPPESARAFAEAARHIERLDVDGGHVGMIAGKNAERALWRPLIDWLKARAT